MWIMQTAILHHDYDTMIFEQNCSLKRKNRDSAINLANGCKFPLIILRVVTNGICSNSF